MAHAPIAIHFGAGNIGRGFLGQLYFESGFATIFVDVAQDLVRALHERGEYPLRIVGEGAESLDICDIDAIDGRDIGAVADAIARADIVSTAVGVNVLPSIAGALAAGIEQRFSGGGAEPLNIIICENLLHAAAFLREKVREKLSPKRQELLEQVGFVEASVGRMVPVLTPAQREEDALLVCAEAYCELPVDAAAFKGSLPDIPHLKPAHDFGAYVERKLFVHNMSHAAAAYLGYLRGHEFIWQAIEDERVGVIVEGAIGEACGGLARKHAQAHDALHAHGEDLLRRYKNRELGDQISRVARDPIRKLGSNDRLVGAMNMCLEQGVEPPHIGMATAAAIHFNSPDDETAQQLQAVRGASGTAGVLREYCGVDTESAAAHWILDGDNRLRQQGWLERGSA